MVTSTVEIQIDKLRNAGQTKLADYVQNSSNDIQQAILSEIDSLKIEKIFVPAKSVIADHKAGRKHSYSLASVDPPHVATVNGQTMEAIRKEINGQFSKAHPVLLLKEKSMASDLLNSIAEIGHECIRNGEVAQVLLAGGQGTRLGYHGAKGCFSPGLPSGKTLFQLHAERLKAVIALAGGTRLPFYIMTSRENDKQTRDYFAANAYFGLDPRDVIIFQQFLMPSFDTEGQVLLSSPSTLSLNPNGNGGVFDSLLFTGCLDDMESRGIKHVHICGVDNLLLKIADPTFIGLCAFTQVPVGNKCCSKRDPHERVGVQAILQDSEGLHPCVVEYTEITPEQAESRHPDTQDLKFSAANIVNHYFSYSFIRYLLQNPRFTYHIAHKKIKYYDQVEGRMVVPDQPNGLKLEYFIFDAFIVADRLLAYEVERSEQFSPIKNADGCDSPKTAVRDLLALHQHWLVNASLLPANDSTVAYEISPLLSYAGEKLDTKVALDGNELLYKYCIST